MITTYRLHVNELSVGVIDSIKAAFQGRTIEIIVTDEVDETAYLLRHDANRKHLFDSMTELEEGTGVEMTVHDFMEKYGLKDENRHA